MASFLTKTKLYLKANSKNWEVETDNISLVDYSDGNGTIIETWNVVGLAKPTTEQLDSYESVAIAEESLQTVLDNRANDYPSIADQLDKIYHSGIDEWKKVIKTTKDKYPK